MEMSDTNRGEDREVGFLAGLFCVLNRPLVGQGALSRLPGLRHRIALLVGAGILLVVVAGRIDVQAPTIQLAPQVAKLAPTLVLPVAMNEQVEGWLERYLTDQRPVFERYLAREGLYAGMIRKRLRLRRMPEDLVFVAAIESGFSPGATSRVSASGMWQFMGPTAQQFGLRIDSYVDERRDPIRATEAALDYLQALYDQFGSWYLAAAAYNAGPTRVARILSVYAGDQTGDEALFWGILEYLPRETREYVPKMLAAILLSDAAEEYGFDVDRADPVRFDRVWVPGATSLSLVARSIDVPLAEMRRLNPHLVRGITPPEGLFPVRVPPGKSYRLVASMGGRWSTFAVDD
jgi:membrane-bound lytic murein transglycosylase D